MSYYVRAFCKATITPSFSELQQHLSMQNKAYRLEGDTDENNIHWTDFEFYYKEDKLPLLVELNWCEEPESVGYEELEEFLEDIGSPGLSLKKRKVIRHLRETKYIICAQFPVSNIDEDGYKAIDTFFKLFVDRYQALLHADGEGFYYGDRIIPKNG